MFNDVLSSYRVPAGGDMTIAVNMKTANKTEYTL